MMNTFRGRTINELVLRALRPLIEFGEHTSSRNGDISVLFNVFMTLENPRSRHLNLIGRKNNIFAMIAETMWVMAGENNIDPFLTFFLPRARDFSDDEKTWRGGYGPRLYLYNQLDDALCVFEEEGIQSRKSVISIYMPELDTKESLQRVYHLEQTKDRPCNNMMHFFITPDKKFHMTVHQRSGDVIWGMGSINIFEWTFLQEFMLGEIQRRVDQEVTLGTYNHFVTNLHLYEFTSKQGYKVLQAEREQILDRLNTSALTFPVGVENNKLFFSWLVRVYNEAILSKETSLERMMKKIHAVFDLYFSDAYEDNLLFGYAVVVSAYICAKNGGADINVDINGFSEEFVSSVRDSAFRKFFLKGYDHKEKTFLHELTTSIIALQEDKEKVYGVDWKRFGLISSMFNVFRKFIRLKTMWEAGWVGDDTDDRRLDTLIDLMNYLILCELLHATLAPDIFGEVFPSVNLDYVSTDEKGFKLFCRTALLGHVDMDKCATHNTTELIGQIISIGEAHVEDWLSQVSSLAQQRKTGDGYSPGSSLDASDEAIRVRISVLYKMIELCVYAIERHASQYPESWKRFTNQHGLHIDPR
ncbi:MAG: hypothetical protein COX81_04075 [Candidatus Magasanikbacteria bacterium CG_4_10_14_0_2_um_filter_37_12]|uniref:Thymidylate synthase/dCMP hydroxymethylase domain-containing protein n=1 Tax=Candidatus Magasanikbacteria bacterium CG_4_10_14_0_2_um_filter_37_12 TaxID=1974637 RepID=A0A2M7V6M0_9BACT|nr:MAG: hypothetical protein COX81_04075 [Candidatus Magasanikbacteria bacterium CG_4_10_14_0_2_um_filter_37_12]